jgi:hypothetical protein
VGRNTGRQLHALIIQAGELQLSCFENQCVLNAPHARIFAIKNHRFGLSPSLHTGWRRPMGNKMSNQDGKVPMSGTYNDVVLGFIQREFLPLKHAAKLLARAAGTTPRCAKAWLSGEHAPNGESLVKLMAECSGLADEVMRLVQEHRAARGEK